MRAAGKTGERRTGGKSTRTEIRLSDEEIGGMDATTVRNILRRHGLRPHQVKTLKVSREPRFELEVRDVVGRTVERHRSAEFLAFLDHVAEGIDPGTPVHVILDNVSSHRSAEVHEWLKDHPDWTFHFTPTSASWMNAVEGFFSRPARQRLKNAVFDSLDACIAAIGGYIEHHNARDARPFRWSRSPEDLVESWKRGHRRLQEMESNE